MTFQRLSFSVLAILLSGCATQARYEAKVQSWENKDSQSLVKAWGQPDSIEKLSNGNRMYVYTRLRHLPVAFGSTRTIASVDGKRNGNASGEVYIRCATYFEMSPSNKIVGTLFRGEECKSRD
jgi:hypothetical protein